MVEAATMKQVTRRILPWLIIAYLICYIDRTNVSFAAVEMSKDVGLSPSQYGLGAGLFFAGYALFEIPSNIILVKVGAVRWMSRIMLTWGIFAAAMALVTSPMSFYIVRFLFGVAEAGFYPGVLIYLTRWFPNRYRARVVGLFMVAGALSGAISGPLAAGLLALDGTAGWAGWQWLFVVEALPALLLAPVLLAVLHETPADARWLSADQRTWLMAAIDRDARDAASKGGQARSRAGLLQFTAIFAFIYFTCVALNNSIQLFLPQVLAASGLTSLQVGFAAVVPAACGVVAMLLWTRHSDRSGERQLHLAIAMLVGGAGLICAAASASVFWQIAGFSIALSGAISAAPCLWVIPQKYYSRTEATVGIAAISSIGILGGFAAPVSIGFIAEQSGSYQTGQMAIGVIATTVGILIAIFPTKRFQRIIS